MPTRGPPGAVWLLGRRRLRRRWHAWAGFALFVGVTGGLLLASAAGARRTETVYDRLLADSAPFDLGVELECPEEEEPCEPMDEDTADTVGALPPVADSVLVWHFLAPITTADGRSLQPDGEPCYEDSGAVELVGAPDGRLGTQLNRYHFVAGGPANPARRDEVVVSDVTARRVGIEVGDRLRMTPVQCDLEHGSETAPAINLKVAGIQVSPGEVEPQAGFYLQSVTVTPPLLRELIDVRDPRFGDSGVLVRLDDGATVRDLVRAAREEGLALDVVGAQDEFRAGVERSLHADTNALWLLTGLGAVAALVILLQAALRELRVGTADVTTLRALGLTGRDLTAVGAFEGTAVGAAASVVAVAVAVALSPLTVIGRARHIEIDAGVRVDPAVLAFGVVAVVLVTAALVTIGSWWVGHSRRRRFAPGRPSTASTVSGWARLTPTMACGARLALEPGRGLTAVPVRTGLACTVLGAAALVGSLTFAASVDHLQATPRLVGWNWDLGVFLGEELPPDAFERVGEIEGVERASFGTYFPTSDVSLIAGIEPAVWVASFSSGPATVRPTITEGRAPAAADEIALGDAVARELDVDIGDMVEIQGGSAEKLTTAEVRMVGTGVLPLTQGFHNRGAMLTLDGLRRLQPDLPPQIAFVDLAAGADKAHVQADLADLGLTDVLDADELVVDLLVGVDVRQADLVPRLLGAVMAVVAAGVLIHLVITGARVRRRELATLRALGFTPGQVRASVDWQALIVTFVSLALAVLLGVAGGRVAWSLYARGLDVLVEPVVPWAATGLLVLCALAVAVLVALVAGRAPARDGVSAHLRSE